MRHARCALAGCHSTGAATAPGVHLAPAARRGDWPTFATYRPHGRSLSNLGVGSENWATSAQPGGGPFASESMRGGPTTPPGSGERAGPKARRLRRPLWRAVARNGLLWRGPAAAPQPLRACGVARWGLPRVDNRPEPTPADRRGRAAGLPGCRRRDHSRFRRDRSRLRASVLKSHLASLGHSAVVHTRGRRPSEADCG